MNDIERYNFWNIEKPKKTKQKEDLKKNLIENKNTDKKMQSEKILVQK